MLAVIVHGNNPNFAIVAAGAAYHRLVIDGAGQHKTVVVIGVFANQIDPAGCLYRQGSVIAKGVAKNGFSGVL